LEASGPNQSQAYWGPEIIGNEQLPALTIDMGVATNVESLNLAFNSEQRESPVVAAQQPDDRSDQAINVGDEFAVNRPAPGSSKPPAKRETKLRDTAKFSPARAKLEGLAVATRSNNAVTAQGSLDTLRYGAILRPRRKVDVRGATKAFNGTWTIRSVTHKISRGEYKQDFELVRNSLATQSVVVKRASS
jgi:phage protein D